MYSRPPSSLPRVKVYTPRSLHHVYRTAGDAIRPTGLVGRDFGHRWRVIAPDDPGRARLRQPVACYRARPEQTWVTTPTWRGRRGSAARGSRAPATDLARWSSSGVGPTRRLGQVLPSARNGDADPAVRWQCCAPRWRASGSGTTCPTASGCPAGDDDHADRGRQAADQHAEPHGSERRTEQQIGDVCGSSAVGRRRRRCVANGDVWWEWDEVAVREMVVVFMA